MTVERVDIGKVTVLRIEGDIDENGVEALRSILYECLSEARVHLVLNLQGVRYITYMGLGVMVERLRKTRQLKGDIKLACLNLFAQRLLRMSGVSGLFAQYESEAQAISVFQEAA
jgi:anti-anti-sigma factor